MDIILSIIVPTLNNQKDINFFLKSIRSQKFPQSKLEVIIADGGSTDKTLAIAKRYKTKILHNKEKFADIGVSLGMTHAKGKLCMVLASDNIFRSKDSLRKMVETFDDGDVIAAFPKQCFAKNDSIYTKYINTFTDPANHFVYGYACNPRTFFKLYKVKKKESTYIVFDFKSNKLLPLLAFAQGFTVRAGFKRDKKNAFDDVAPVLELVKSKKQIAYVHSVDLYHHTVSDLQNFIHKQAWRTRNYLDKKNFGISHRVKLLSDEQTKRIAIWPLYSLTLLPTFFYATYHLIKDREIMWILHPFMCIISAYTSLYVYISYKFKK